MSYIKSILRSDENVVFKTKRHWIIFVWPVFFAFIGLSFITNNQFFWGLLLFIPMVLDFIDYQTSEFAVTNKRVVAKVGFIRRNSIEVLLTKVEGIRIEQSILGRMLNYGAIITGAAGSSNPFTSIANPIQVRRSVDEQLTLVEQSKR
jgi:uncharacterized membrane protein YdbT with pleckstrin-like domain